MIEGFVLSRGFLVRILIRHGLLGIHAFHEPAEEVANLLVVAADGIESRPVNMVA